MLKGLVEGVIKNGLAGMKPNEYIVKVEFIEWSESAGDSDKSVTIVVSKDKQ